MGVEGFDGYEELGSSDPEENVQNFINTRLPDLPVDAADIASKQIRSEASQDLVFSADEGHIYYTAFEYYRELVKAARKYNKFICKQTGQKLNGKRVLKNPSAGVKWSATFNPFIHVLTLKTPVFKNSNDIVPDEMLTSTFEIIANTSDEAQIRMATKLGFSQIERNFVRSKFHAATMQKIEGDPRYLQIVRATLEDKEQIKQIQDADYVPTDRRKYWLHEIEERIQKLKQDLAS